MSILFSLGLMMKLVLKFSALSLFCEIVLLNRKDMAFHRILTINIDISEFQIRRGI